MTYGSRRRRPSRYQEELDLRRDRLSRRDRYDDRDPGYDRSHPGRSRRLREQSAYNDRLNSSRRSITIREDVLVVGERGEEYLLERGDRIYLSKA